jgi:hypothetical protein
MIDKESFDEWLAHPVTEHVLKRVGALAEQNKQKWIDESWGAGNCDPMTLVELKARAQAATDLSELRFEDISDDGNNSLANRDSQTGTE